MKISTRGRYALRLRLDLALNHTGAFIPLKAVAQRQGISDKYLEQITHQLNKHDFLQSSRGAQGGYRLARTPREYTVGEILRAVESSLAPVPCLDCATPCDKLDSCITIGLYKKIQQAIEGVVDHTTLADMIDDYQRKQPND